MGYKETYEAYINLSRRELQGLCKKHNLPANKCQSELAKSLASYFKKKNSSLVDTGEASSVPAKEKSQEKTSDEDNDKNENHHDKRLAAKVGNELRAASPILIESSQEGINTEEAIDGIINNGISSTLGVVLRDQDLISQSPTKREEQASPLEPSSDNINLKSQSPTKCGAVLRDEDLISQSPTNGEEQASPLEPSSDNINLKSQSPTKCSVVLRDQDLISQSPTKREEQVSPLEPSSDNINLKSQSPTKCGVVLRDQNLIFRSPTKREEQVSPLEPSSDNINLKSQSPTKCQNHVLPSQCTCNDKSTIRLAAESPTATETAARPASFQLFVASEEGINLFVDLNSGPSDWVQSLKDEICMNPATQSCSISSLVKDTNSSLSSVLSENLPSESVPLEGIHNLADIPTQIENKLGGIQEGDTNEKMEPTKTVEGDSKEVCEISVSEPNLLVPSQNGDKLVVKMTDSLTKELSVVGPADKVVVLDSATAEGDSKEVCEISVSEPNSLVPCQKGDNLAGKITDPLTEELSAVGPADKVVVLDSATAEGDSKEVCEISVSESNSLVPCQNGDKLAGKITDPLTEELSVVGPTDKVVVLDSATADSLFSSSDMVDDISVPKASDSSGSTLGKKLKRALNQGSEDLSQNRKHHVVEESNKRNFTKNLRSSSKAQKDNISVLPRRSTRLVFKV